MVLLPMDALSLAGTVVQFIDFTCKLVSKGNEYYRSVDGALVEYKELKTVAANLQRLSKSLSTSVAVLPARNQLSVEETSLKSVAEICEEVAQEFIDLIAKLKVPENSTKWKSFLQAFKTIWKKDEIETILDRLSRAREQLVLNLLVFMNQKSEKELSKLHGHNERLEMKLFEELKRASSSVETQIARLTEELKKSDKKQAQNHVQQHTQIVDDWGKRNEKLLSDLSANISAKVEEEVIKMIQIRLLDSLYFTQIDERYHLIKEAYSKTFKWIFDERPMSNPSWTDFTAWLRDVGDQSKIYWVTGKPGSGKSTLIKHLADNPETHRHLKSWAASRQLVMASYFFWNPGTPLQKSLHGLLSSLLYQLLNTCPDISKSVASFRWRSYELGAVNLSPWTDVEMLHTLHRFIEISASSRDVCIFIDGLDEFSGNDDTREDLIALLKKVASMTTIKICLSSRPWNIFEDAFGDGPKLRLEDLTREDVRLYVHDLLNQNSRFSMLSRQNPLRCQGLVSEIVDKAKGVFLWVFLVVRSLLQGLRNEDGIDDLSRRLRLMPADLEAFFKQMLLSVDEFYRSQSSELFQVVSCTDQTQSLLSLSFIHEADVPALIERLRTSPKDEINQRHVSMKRRLNALCQGLLEVHLSETRHTPLFENHRSKFFEYQIHYLHRTVRDFLQLDDVGAILHSFSGGPYDSSRALCRAFLGQMDALVMNSNHASLLFDFEALLAQFVACAISLEMSSMKAPVDLYNELEKTYCNFITRNHAVFDLHSTRYTMDDRLPGLKILYQTEKLQTSGFVSFLMQSGRLPAAVNPSEADSPVPPQKPTESATFIEEHPQLPLTPQRTWETIPELDEEAKEPRGPESTQSIGLRGQTLGTASKPPDSTDPTTLTQSAESQQSPGKLFQVYGPIAQEKTPQTTLSLERSTSEQKETQSIQGKPKSSRGLWSTIRRMLCYS